MIFKNLSFLMLWIKVALALEGLRFEAVVGEADKRHSEACKCCNVLYSSALGVAPQLVNTFIGVGSNNCLHILLKI